MACSTVKNLFAVVLKAIFLGNGQLSPKYLCSPKTTKALRFYASVSVMKPELA